MSKALPVVSYVSDAIFHEEQSKVFAVAPQYRGHLCMVPNLGDYYTLPVLEHAKMLRHTIHGVELVSNVCRHRQSIMLSGQGNSQTVVCPLHRWTYNNEGSLLGAPHFAEKPCLNLLKTPVLAWNGLLFEAKQAQITSMTPVLSALSSLSVLADMDFTGYQLDAVKTEDYNFNWKTFIEVYLEDYHVETFHPGLAGFVQCNDLQWEFSDCYSVQIVGVKNALSKAGSSIYQRWHEQVLAYHQDALPKHGAIWLLIYPNIMVEWYPSCLVVSTIVPKGAMACTHIAEFYYPEDIVLFERDFVEAQQAAYAETADEDTEICQRMDTGRRALFAAGEDDAGPYQIPMEAGMPHFHAYYRARMGA